MTCGAKIQQTKEVHGIIKYLNSHTMEELKLELKEQIIEALNLEEMTPDDIDEDAALFGDDGLGLDSIDALELIVLLEKRYGIKLANPAEGKAIFKNVSTIAEYVSKNRKR
jgi:acyl carrier protein